MKKDKGVRDIIDDFRIRGPAYCVLLVLSYGIMFTVKQVYSDHAYKEMTLWECFSYTINTVFWKSNMKQAINKYY